MTNDIQSLQTTLNTLADEAKVPFWQHGDFWLSIVLALVGIVVGAFGVYYAWKAFVEAGEAKKAARLAGKVVKFQSVSIELRQLELGELAKNIQFSDVRNNLAAATENLHRILFPFQNEPQFKDTITKMFTVLTATRESLNSVKPKNDQAEQEAPQAIYNAVEAYFAEINELKGDLTGLFEQKTTDNIGGNNATE
jgi:hypothetical protein